MVAVGLTPQWTFTSYPLPAYPGALASWLQAEVTNTAQLYPLYPRQPTQATPGSAFPVYVGLTSRFGRPGWRWGSPGPDPDVWTDRALQEGFFEMGKRSCVNVSGLVVELFCSGP